MVKFKEVTKIVLDENRMLVLAAQVLLGFAFQAVFQPGFARLPPDEHLVHFVAFVFLVAAFAILLMIPAFHLGAWNGRDGRRFLHFATVTLGWALLPFTIALGLEIQIVAGKILNPAAGALLAVAVVLLCLLAWYVYPLMRARKTPHEHLQNDEMNNQLPPLKDRINQVLTECRVVLPGTQALLGFQFIACLTDAFDKLPKGLQVVHLGALLAIVGSALSLMLPAAFHRIGEHGRDSEELHALASRCLLAALGFLAAGLTLDLFVVSAQIWNAHMPAFLSAGVTLLLLVTVWFILPAIFRARFQTADHARGNESSVQ